MKNKYLICPSIEIIHQMGAKKKEKYAVEIINSVEECLEELRRFHNDNDTDFILQIEQAVNDYDASKWDYDQTDDDSIKDYYTYLIEIHNLLSKQVALNEEGLKSLAEKENVSNLVAVIWGKIDAIRKNDIRIKEVDDTLAEVEASVPRDFAEKYPYRNCTTANMNNLKDNLQEIFNVVSRIEEGIEEARIVANMKYSAESLEDMISSYKDEAEDEKAEKSEKAKSLISQIKSKSFHGNDFVPTKNDVAQNETFPNKKIDD